MTNQKLGRKTKGFYRNPQAKNDYYDKVWTIVAKFRGTCYQCDKAMSKGSTIRYNASIKAGRHMKCEPFIKEYVRAGSI